MRVIQPAGRSSDVETEPRDCGQPPPCIVCGSGHFHTLHGLEEAEVRVWVCGKCGTGRNCPPLNPDEVRGLYSDDYYGGENEGKFRPLVETIVRIAGRRKARRLARGLLPGARILDLGCGRGTNLGVFADFGLDVHGLEVSKRAARGADPRAVIHIAERLSDVCFPPRYFDRVVIWHVLEHLVDPRETLLEVNRVLKPGGQVAVAVPNFSSTQARWAASHWLHLDLPRHLHHFTLEALLGFIESCGFRCCATQHFSFRQNPFGWVQSALNRSGWFPKNELYGFLQGDGGAVGSSPMGHFALLAFFVAAMPFALVLSWIMALLERGATVSVVAEKRASIEKNSSFQ